MREGEYDVRLRLVVSLVGLTSANPGTIGELRTRRRPNVDQSPGAARWSMDLDSLGVVSWGGESDPGLSTSQMGFARGILRSRLPSSTVCLRVLGLKLRGNDSESSMSKYELGFSRIFWSMPYRTAGEVNSAPQFRAGVGGTTQKLSDCRDGAAEWLPRPRI